MLSVNTFFNCFSETIHDARSNDRLITLGAVLFLGAEIYGLAVLKPFVGRPFDDDWHEQIASVDAAATLGLLLSSLGLFIHSRKS